MVEIFIYIIQERAVIFLNRLRVVLHIFLVLLCLIPTVGCWDKAGMAEIDAGEDRIVLLDGNAVVLYGSPTGLRMNGTERWTLESTPGGAPAPPLQTQQEWSDTRGDLVKLTFTPVTVGLYKFKFSRISFGDREEDLVSVVVVPQADAGPDISFIYPGAAWIVGNQPIDLVELSAEISWTVVSCPPGSGSAPGNLLSYGKTCDFNVGIYQTPGDWELKYEIHYLFYDRAAARNAFLYTSDTVRIHVLDNPPTADAGYDERVDTGTLVVLKGDASYDLFRPITYAWTIRTKPPQSQATLVDADKMRASFIPDVAGEYRIELVVNNGLSDSLPAFVTITADPPPTNLAPTASAGSDQPVTTNTLVTLDGSGSSDPNGDPLTYSWTLSSRPLGSNAALSDPNLVNPSFTADLEGDYLIDLVVSDGLLSSALDTVKVTATGATPPPPNGTVTSTADLQTLLANHAFLINHVTAASGLLEVFEFGPVGGAATFTYNNPYGATVRRTGAWSVADAGGFPQATEAAGPRILNTAAPINDTNALTMSGYKSYTDASDQDIQTWIKVNPVTTSSFTGLSIEYNGGPPTPKYTFTADAVTRTGEYKDNLDVLNPFTWSIDGAGQKAILTFQDGSSHHIFLPIDPFGSVVKQVGILTLNSGGTVTGGSLRYWVVMRSQPGQARKRQ